MSTRENHTSDPLRTDRQTADDSTSHATSDHVVPLTINAAGAATLCGISRTSWYSLLAAGRAPKSIRLGGRTVWRIKELEAWIEASCPPLQRWEQIKSEKPSRNGR